MDGLNAATGSRDATWAAAAATALRRASHGAGDRARRRCLIHVVYRRRGVAPSVVPPISLVLATRSADYIGGLEEFRFGDPVEWLVFFAVATIAAARRARGLAARIEQLGDRWIHQLGNPRSDASSRKLVQQLPAEPIVTVARAAELSGVSNTAADNALRALEQAGVLKPVNGQRWGRRWEAADVFALLDAFEQEMATLDGDQHPARPAPSPAR